MNDVTYGQEAAVARAAEPDLDAGAFDKIAKFRELADQIEAFLCCQLERCEAILAQTPRSESQEVSRLQEEFLQQREQWNLEREQEFERLRKEANWLADAWERLEAEERRIAGQRATLQACGKSAQRRPRFTPSDPDVPTVETAMMRSPTCSGGGAELAWVQFQQLRREIQKHAQHAQP